MQVAEKSRAGWIPPGPCLFLPCSVLLLIVELYVQCGHRGLWLLWPYTLSSSSSDKSPEGDSGFGHLWPGECDIPNDLGLSRMLLLESMT